MRLAAVVALGFLAVGGCGDSYTDSGDSGATPDTTMVMEIKPPMK